MGRSNPEGLRPDATRARSGAARPGSRLSVRAALAIGAGRAASWLSRAAGRGRGHVIGGQIMLRLSPRIIAELALGKQVTLVSATNGKSTTTRFVAEAMRERAPVAHNATGANMAPGIAMALADSRHAPAAALEVDEAHLPVLLEETRARTVVLMNLSRDQLDRGAEVKRLAVRWRTMLEGVTWPLCVVGNADDPLVAWACLAGKRVRWVAAGQRWNEDSVLCPACSSVIVREAAGWHCSGCALRRPEPEWLVTEDAIVLPSGQALPVHLALPGWVNIANAAMAAAAVETWGVEPDSAVAAFERVEDVDGRYIKATVDGWSIRLLLGKNPASWAELIEMVSVSGQPMIVAINARGADGRDPSWLWDAPFEKLAGKKVWATGERRFDLAVRLSVAGMEVAGVSADPLAALGQLRPAGTIDVVANYTAFQSLRARVTP